MTYCLRLRFRVTGSGRINSDSHEVSIADPAGKDVTLRSIEPEKPIAESEHLALVAKSYPSEAEAFEAGMWWRAVLPKAFARVRVGADFGEHGPSSVVTEKGLEWFRVQFGTPNDQPLLTDVHGLMVFECDPWPRFARAETSQIQVGRSAERVFAAVEAAARLGARMPPREQLSYELFSASFAQPTADSRFVVLVMAIEALIEPASRAKEVVVHVGSLIEATRQSDIPIGEVNSIIGSLRWLRDESIAQAGRRLVSRLGDRQYQGRSPQKFFTECYTIRSQLVHGHMPRPTWAQVNEYSAELEGFVGDLLSPELLDEVPI
jgi:hypothetical protein